MRKSSVVSSQTEATDFSHALPRFSNEIGLAGGRNKAQANLELMEEARARAVEEGYRIGLAKGRTEGFKLGREEGTIEGREEAAAEAAALHAQALADFRAALEEIVSQINAGIPKFYDAAEQAMTDLAMDAVRKVLAAELEISRESALAIVQEALREVTHSTKARIRVNVQDRKTLEVYRAEVLAAAGSLREIEFVDDPSLAGGCVIETEGGLVDASLETKLELLEEELRRAA